MSDLTNLSYQYQRRADFAQQVNDAVLNLKRQTNADQAVFKDAGRHRAVTVATQNILP